MQGFFDRLVQFVQQGIGALFRFIQFVWIWSIGQITSLLQTPLQELTPWKQVLLGVIIFGIGYTLYWAAKDLWAAGQAVLVAFGTLLTALVKTLPRVLVAGLIALAAVWVLNNVDLSRIRFPEYRSDNSNGR